MFRDWITRARDNFNLILPVRSLDNRHGGPYGQNPIYLGVTRPRTLTAFNNTRTGNVYTFDQTGLDSSADSTVVRVDYNNHDFSELPYVVGDSGSIIYYYYSTVYSSTSGKRFALVSVTSPARAHSPDGTSTDTYDMQDPTGYTGVISQITVHAVVKLTNTNGGHAHLAIRTASTGGIDDTSSQRTLSTSYSDITGSWSTKPGTSSAWTWTDITALQCSVELTRSSGEVRCTAVWVVVEYTPLT